MILVAAPDSNIDHTDRALWVTIPFDLRLRAVSPPPACRTYVVPAEDRTYTVTCG